mgnify:CR=1 FL=1
MGWKYLEMITYKKKFDFYATNEELDSFVYSIVEALIGDLDDEIEVDITEDDNNRQLTVKILNQVLN